MDQRRNNSVTTADKVRRKLRAARMRYDETTGVAIGLDGMLGPTGTKGHPGVAGIHTELYMLSYAGLPFKVRLKPETFAMIEDATQLNGDELSFIRVVDEHEWKSIREAWAEEWNKRRADRAFDLGEMMPDE